jgi:NAD(P)-dependent dehydrogenase (short-subunit alcohol dehydrogenase family)
MKHSDLFDGKNVYITGGSSGIGLAVAGLAAAAGANVLIFARDETRLKQAAEKIRSVRRDQKQKVAWHALDVTNVAVILPAFWRNVEQFGPPDILFNSAGQARPNYFEKINAEQFDATLKLNLYGTRHAIAAALPHMKPGGYIVNVSSVAGLIGVFGYTDYSASKFAVIGFSEALRAELKPRGITVSVLCPPDTDTPGLEAENVTKPAETRAISANARTIPAEAVALALLRGMAKKKFLIIPGLDARLSVLVKRLAPGLVEWIMNRTIARIHQSSAK